MGRFLATAGGCRRVAVCLLPEISGFSARIMRLFALLLCLGLAASRPEPEPQIEVEDVYTLDDPEVTEGYYEGDIELPKFRNAIRNPNGKWPSGIVYYRLSTAFPSTTRATILQAMREMESN